ncbi:MAG: pknB 43 [Gemmataceae bacterium]|nr:pknB 43 [Gemmataceae bacterium]
MSPESCPPTGELEQLIRGRLSDARAAALTDHVGHCPACQDRMEVLAAGDDAQLTACVRHCDRLRPPAESALWPALSAAAAVVTATAVAPLDTDPHPSGELDLRFLQPADSPGLIGRLGAFDIIRVVGRGGMGVVLHGHDPCLERDVAVKVLDPLLANNEIARRRFCREARAAAAVTHDNIVAVHQVDEDATSGLPYLVMQLVVGESLEQRLKRVGKLSAAEVARLGAQAAAGLAAAHAGGLIHRDIKPGNILLEEGTDRVKLTDFGLARGLEDVKLTRTGFVAGTPLYMAPEQAHGEGVDHRADLFSLGSVLYEAATGTHPFDGKTPLAVLRRVADETQRALRDVDPTVPRWLSDVIDRLLAKDPADRFQSAAEVADIFTTEIARAHPKAGHDVPSGLCGDRPSAYALRSRKKICWRGVALKAVPFAAGVVLGGLGGLWAGGLWSGGPDPSGHDAAVGPAQPDPGPAPKAVTPGKAGPVWAIGFTPDGQTLVSGAEDGTIRLWDVRDLSTPRRTLPRMGGNVWSVDVSGDGRYMVATCDDSEVKVFDLKTFHVEWSFPHPTSAKTAVFSPTERKLATGDRDATVRVWDLDTQIPTELSGHRGTVHRLAYSPDGKQLASAGSDGTVKVWNLTDPKAEPVSLEEHAGSVYGVAFSPDREKPRLASAGWDGTVRIWDPLNGVQVQTLRGHDGDVWAVAFGHGGKLLASAGSDGTVRLWDVETGKELQTFRGTARGYQAVRFAKDGTTLAAAGRDGIVRVWDVGK